MKFAIWRLYPEKPGCVDYLGSISAGNHDEAEIVGRKEFGCDLGDEIDVQVDDEEDGE